MLVDAQQEILQQNNQTAAEIQTVWWLLTWAVFACRTSASRQPPAPRPASATPSEPS